MPPDRARTDSRTRAEEAYRLQCRGWTLQEIADKLDFRSRSSALTAIRRHILRMPPEDLETKRTYTAGTYQQSLASLFRQLAKAEDDNDHAAVATLNRAIADVADKHAKLTGQHVVQAREVEVKGQVQVQHSSAQAVISQATQDFLAIAAGHADAGRLPVIDGEVITEQEPA
ncbi:MAG: hypothetical protein PGN37_20525 [Mycobacterium kyogaense]|uniref:hypothetical protein n=1 Tax=Mycobacterium kyogaense TaxID=2212479 RepID=UPI002FFCF0C8